MEVEMVTKILVTGASGLLGSKLVDLALMKGYDVYSAYNDHIPSLGKPVKLNITEISEVEKVMNSIKPDVIVHAAALTDVDKCEVEKDLAMKVNFKGTMNVAKAARKIGSFIIYISTDYVFYGDRSFYKEDDDPNPVNFYGYTKLKGEEAVMELYEDFCIARTSVLYGSKPARGKVNFALWLLEKFKKGEVIKVVNQYASPTLNTNLAEMLIEVIERRLTGIYHLAGASRVSRIEMATMLADIFNMDKNLIIPSRIEDMSWIAKRPKDSSLNVSKAFSILKTKPLELSKALSKLKAELD
jgi:dTDP-4-dehydrorhamnose reductase